MALRIPSFDTTCEYETKLDGGTWYIYLKTSGTFDLKFSKSRVDIFLQGGGGGGASSGGSDNGAAGGGGGYQTTMYEQAIGSGRYEIIIGAGGAPDNAGGVTAAFGFEAAGGGAGDGRTGGAGTGYGGIGGWYWDGNNTGSPGGDGGDGKRAFDSGDIYYGAGGGGGASKFGSPSGKGGNTGGGDSGKNGTANTGSGGGGKASGGSGIIILRGTQDDQLPVKFDGVTLQSILYEGEEVMHLIHDGTQIFIEKVGRWFKRSRQRMRSALLEA